MSERVKGNRYVLFGLALIVLAVVNPYGILLATPFGIDNTLPSVVIVNPTEGQDIVVNSLSELVFFSFTASDASGVTAFEPSVGGTVVIPRFANGSAMSYYFTQPYPTSTTVNFYVRHSDFTTVAGAKTMTILVADVPGNVGSDSVGYIVSIYASPTAQVISPVANTVVRGTIEIRVRITSNVQYVTSITAKVDDTNNVNRASLAMARQTGTDDWAVNFNTATLVDGSYILKAEILTTKETIILSIVGIIVGSGPVQPTAPGAEGQSPPTIGGVGLPPTFSLRFMVGAIGVVLLVWGGARGKRRVLRT